MTAALLSSTAMPFTLLTWKPLVKASLRGFAGGRLGRSLILHDIAVMASNGKFWCGLPGKPMIGADGTALRDDKGKIRYTAILEWDSKEARDRFSLAVIAAVREQYGPEALANDA